LHIAEIVAAEARRNGVRKAAVLGTRWLVESEVYPDALGIHGIDYLRPDPEEREEIGRIIMEELVNDVQSETAIHYFVELIGRMKARGCDAAILGCTEIPLIISDNNSPLRTLDSTRLLADAALSHAIAAEVTK
jgi:aspartate racemase